MGKTFHAYRGNNDREYPPQFRGYIFLIKTALSQWIRDIEKPHRNIKKNGGYFYYKKHRSKERKALIEKYLLEQIELAKEPLTLYEWLEEINYLNGEKLRKSMIAKCEKSLLDLTT